MQMLMIFVLMNMEKTEFFVRFWKKEEKKKRRFIMISIVCNAEVFYAKAFHEKAEKNLMIFSSFFCFPNEKPHFSRCCSFFLYNISVCVSIYKK